MNSETEKILIEALDLLEAGESAERILARYPEHEAEIRPILQTATAVAQLSYTPSITARRTGRLAMLAQADRLRRRPRWQIGGWWLRQGSALAPLLGLFVMLLVAWSLWSPVGGERGNGLEGNGGVSAETSTVTTFPTRAVTGTPTLPTTTITATITVTPTVMATVAPPTQPLPTAMPLPPLPTIVPSITQPATIVPLTPTVDSSPPPTTESEQDDDKQDDDKQDDDKKDDDDD